MLSIPACVRVFLAVDPCDMRKSFDGLQAVAREVLGEDPGSGALFLFSNRRRNLVKVLYFDGNGVWVLAKRLERGRFSWPRGAAEGSPKLSLNRRALALLLDGVELEKGHKKAWFEG